MAVNGEKLWARNQRRYKRYVVNTPGVVISELYCMSHFMNIQVPSCASVSTPETLQVPGGVEDSALMNGRLHLFL